MAQPVRVYIASAAEDKAYRDELDKHLAQLQRQDHICTWHRGKLQAGASFAQTPRKELESAQIIVLLLTSDLLSECNQEIELALSQHQNNAARVVPVMVRPCYKDAVKALRDIVPLREGKCPTNKREREECFFEVAKLISKELEDLRTSRDTSPAADDDSPRGKMRTKLKEHLQSVPSIPRKLIEKLKLPKTADLEQLVHEIFDVSRPALDLAKALHAARTGLGPSDLLTLQEIARLVLPQSKEARDEWKRWKEELAGRHLVLPYLSHAEAEMALAALSERPYQEKLHEAENHSDTKLVSEALFPASEIRSGSTKAALSEERFFLEEVARYFATKVRFGENRRKAGKYIYSHGDPRLNNFEEVVAQINYQLEFHQEDADVADLLTMHIEVVEVDVPDLAERLRDRESADRLLHALGKTFPRLSFVQLAPKPTPDPDGYLRLLLVTIFSKHKPTPT